MTPQTDEASPIAAIRRRHHPGCVVCGTDHASGFRIMFDCGPDEEVIAQITPPSAWEGYPGLVHGGVIASLLDGGMTNCLFARNIAAYTADLHVRYRHPVEINRQTIVRARVVRSLRPLFLLKATIQQGELYCVTATGKFMEQPLQH